MFGGGDVPELVLADLLPPPVGVGRGPGGVLRATVQEASVDEDGELDPCEGDVDRPASHARYTQPDSVPQAGSMEQPPQLEFGLRVLARLSTHPQRHARRTR